MCCGLFGGLLGGYWWVWAGCWFGGCLVVVYSVFSGGWSCVFADWFVWWFAFGGCGFGLLITWLFLGVITSCVVFVVCRMLFGLCWYFLLLCGISCFIVIGCVVWV